MFPVGRSHPETRERQDPSPVAAARRVETLPAFSSVRGVRLRLRSRKSGCTCEPPDCVRGQLANTARLRRLPKVIAHVLDVNASQRPGPKPYSSNGLESSAP